MIPTTLSEARTHTLKKEKVKIESKKREERKTTSGEYYININNTYYNYNNTESLP